MPRKLYCCNGCRNILRLDKPRIHCQICPEYNSCAECHVIEFFSGLHSASHDYEVFLDGNRILTKEGKTVTKLPQPDTLKQIPSETSKPKSSCTSTGSPSNTTDPPGTANTAELYWGSVVKDKLLCPVFVRLLAAIFNHYDKTVYPAFTGWMEPSKFCAVWLGAGYSALDMPILTYAAHPTPSASDMYELDQNLTVLFQSLRVEHKMATREPPMIPFPKPFGDGLRSGPVPNGMPLLPRRGFEQYILFQILVDPTETSLRLNHLLALLPPLIDSETKQPFKYRHIPRSCFPPLLDPGAEELRRCIEKQRRGMQAWKEARDAENAWRPPMPGDNIYNRTKSPDFMHMTGVGRWAGRFQGGY